MKYGNRGGRNRKAPIPPPNGELSIIQGTVKARKHVPPLGQTPPRKGCLEPIPLPPPRQAEEGITPPD